MPSDPVAEALARAKAPVERTSLSLTDSYRAGWAQAVDAIDDVHHWLHAGDQRPDCGDWCLVRQAIAAFVAAFPEARRG